MKVNKIVLVEDDKIFSKILFEELTDLGFEVFRAYDGKEGVEMIKRELPDLVLLDLLLPKKDGFSVLEDIMAGEDTRSIPVVVLTNMNNINNVAEAMELGARAYFVKSDQDIDGLVEIMHNEIKTL